MVSMTFLFYSWKEDVSTNREGKGAEIRSSAINDICYSNSAKRINFVLKANIKVKKILLIIFNLDEGKGTESYSWIKGTVSRDGYFFEGLIILISPFCVCAFKVFQKLFSNLYNY